MRCALMDVLSRKAYLALMSLASPDIPPAYKSIAHSRISACAPRTQVPADVLGGGAAPAPPEYLIPMTQVWSVTF
jgi:hypothetical protein